MSVDASSLSASKILATTAYLFVVGAVALVLALTDRPELIVVWFGFAGLGGVGGAIKSQLSAVAHTVGVQHLENGNNLAQLTERNAALETYTHQQMHDLKNDATVIKGALVRANLLTAEEMATGQIAGAPPPPPPPLPSAPV